MQYLFILAVILIWIAVRRKKERRRFKMAADDNENTQAEFNKLLQAIVRTTAQMAARMTLAIESGASPNKVETWMKHSQPTAGLPPEAWQATMKHAEIVLAIVIEEIAWEHNRKSP